MVSVMKIYSNSGTTYTIVELIAKDSLNIANLMQTFEIILL